MLYSLAMMGRAKMREVIRLRDFLQNFSPIHFVDDPPCLECERDCAKLDLETSCCLIHIESVSRELIRPETTEYNFCLDSTNYLKREGPFW